MNFRHIKVDQTSPAVATVTFNRPAKANALHYEHLADIEAYLAKTTPTFAGN